MTDHTEDSRTCVCGNPAPEGAACPQCGAPHDADALQTSAKAYTGGPLETVPVGSEGYAEMQARVEREGKIRPGSPTLTPEQEAVVSKTLAEAPKLRTVIG